MDKKSDCEPINIDIVNKVKPNMPDMNLLYELSDFFKVMGDSTRIQLLWALEESEMCVGDLAVLLNMTKSAVSHQLKVLRTAKLVRAEKKGKNVYYALNDHHVKSILEKPWNMSVSNFIFLFLISAVFVFIGFCERSYYFAGVACCYYI